LVKKQFMKNLFMISQLLIFLITVSCSSNSENTYKDPREAQKFKIYEKVIDHIKNELKSPSTAKFPDKETWIFEVTHINGYHYTVFSWVDSQNSYGAIIRTSFFGEADLKGDEVILSNFVFLN